jgi:hypothetical protein
MKNTSLNDAYERLWKVVPGFGGILEAGPKGVRTSDDKHVCRIFRNKRLYPTIVFDHKHFKVHELVAAAWLETPPPIYKIEHIDGDISNFSPDNLKYTDLSEEFPEKRAEIRKVELRKKARTRQKELQRPLENQKRVAKDTEIRKRGPQQRRYGSNSPSARLDECVVMEIIYLHDTGNYRLTELAAATGVNKSTVLAITSGKSWRNVSIKVCPRAWLQPDEGKKKKM